MKDVLRIGRNRFFIIGMPVLNEEANYIIKDLRDFT